MATTPTGPRPREPLGELALKVLGAGAAGVGSAGFVTGVGGAVTYVRFGRAGLAPEQVVAIQPKAVLLTLGAEALVPLGAAIVLGVAAYYVIDRIWRRAAAMMAPAKVRRPRSTRTLIAATGLAGGLAAFVYYGLAVDFSFNTGSAWVVFDIVVAVSAWILLGSRIRGFLARATALAVLIALLAAAIGLARTYNAPKLRGAAVFLGKADKVVSGLFVAETKDVVYLGEVTPSTADGDLPRAGSGAIVALDRGDVATLVLGSSQGLSGALRDAAAMAAALRENPDGSSVAAALGR